MATELGWSYGDIDELTMLDVDDIYEHWKTNPPVPVLVRAYLGVKSEKPKRADKKGLQEFAKMLGG